MKKSNKKTNVKVILIISLIIICIIGLIIYIIPSKDKNIEKSSITTTKNTISESKTTKNIDSTTSTSTTKETTTTKKKTSTKTPKKEENITSSKTTKTTTTTKSNKTVIKNVLSTEDGSEVVNEETKYGVIETKIKYYEVVTYTDGSTEKLTKRFETNFNRDGYNGNTDSFKSEASTLVSNNQSIYQSVLNHTNQYRSEVGVTDLILDNNLSLAATIRALEMAWSGQFSHTRPNSMLFNTVLDELGYTYLTVGENIAEGYGSAASVSEGWRNSAGHYANMINPDYGKIGIGMAEVGDTKYWVQIFTN